MKGASHKPILATSAQVIELQSLEAAAGQTAIEASEMHLQSAPEAGFNPKLPLIRDGAAEL
jgi:hypothetical protein